MSVTDTWTDADCMRQSQEKPNEQGIVCRSFSQRKKLHLEKEELSFPDAAFCFVIHSDKRFFSRIGS